MKQLRLLVGLSLTMLALAVICGNASAGANDSATGDIPSGTKITMQNWHQYAAFMPAGMQALFEGKYFWKMPADIELIVGPTVVHPLPLFYQQATERYASRVKLVATPDGGLMLRDYVAGMPFPNPQEPHKGWKILANLWYRYFPYLVSTPTSSYENLCREDRFSNLACSTEVAVYRQLRHLANTGSSTAMPDSGDSSGPSFSEFWMTETPEDQKYTSGLTLYYDSQPQADYLFTPKLRRAIRINAGARCSESSGSDFMEDDWRNGFSGDIWNFQAQFVQRMKMLTLINFGTEAGNLAEQDYYFPLMWPRPDVGQMGAARYQRDRYSAAAGECRLLLRQTRHVCGCQQLGSTMGRPLRFADEPVEGVSRRTACARGARRRHPGQFRFARKSNLEPQDRSCHLSLDHELVRC